MPKRQPLIRNLYYPPKAEKTFQVACLVAIYTLNGHVGTSLHKPVKQSIRVGSFYRDGIFPTTLGCELHACARQIIFAKPLHKGTVTSGSIDVKEIDG